MTQHNDTIARWWVNASQSAAIRLGDWTPAELRTIADELEKLLPPVPIATADATPAEGGWEYRPMWSKTQNKNVHCAVNRAFGIVVPFGDEERIAKLSVNRFNDGTDKAADYYAPSIEKYEEAHV